MQEIGRKYPNCGYGGMFSQWVFNDDPEPYNSYGNGDGCDDYGISLDSFIEQEKLNGR